MKSGVLRIIVLLSPCEYYLVAAFYLGRTLSRSNRPTRRTTCCPTYRRPLRQLVHYDKRHTKVGSSLQKNDPVNDDNSDTVDWEALSAELVAEDEDDGLNDGDWLPDREKARQMKAQARRIYAEHLKQDEKKKGNEQEDTNKSNRPSPYTEEEEDVISSMGGKTMHSQRRREPGFLGDSTLQEIATDYSVPISYIADVLAMWGVPVPIDVNEHLGNLVTGEQAFALLEAVNSLDVSQLHDRYSNTNILNLCEEWGIDLREAFEMAMKEGWSIPFGVRTCLRVEQEEELLRVLGDQGKLDMARFYTEDD